MSTRIGVAVMAAVLALYIWFVAERAWALVVSGDAVGIAMGVALIVIPLIAAWALARELAFGIRADGLVKRLEQEGRLPAEPIDVSPTGRPDRAQADALFPAYQADVEAHPDDWRAWMRLSMAYDGAGDRKRARAAVRTAITLSRGDRA